MLCLASDNVFDIGNIADQSIHSGVYNVTVSLLPRDPVTSAASCGESFPLSCVHYHHDQLKSNSPYAACLGQPDWYVARHYLQRVLQLSVGLGCQLAHELQVTDWFRQVWNGRETTLEFQCKYWQNNLGY